MKKAARPGSGQFALAWGEVSPREARSLVAQVRFASRDQCWGWSGDLNAHGRPIIGDGRGGVSTIAARRIFVLFRGRVPPARELDHTCNNRVCVNPWHLEPVTRKVNMARYGALTTHCRQGHLYDAANTYWRKRGNRDCRRCNADRQARRRA